MVVIIRHRREENLQDVPITVQTINGEQLKQLSVTTFNDLLQYTTNVTYSGNGPATGNIFIRGLGAVGTGNQQQSTIAPFPNVALYLDEQSMQFPARNNDVYMVDLERVEVLEGPQGTLFGGGAQAGAIRYITNKPKLGVTSGEANAAYGTTAAGRPRRPCARSRAREPCRRDRRHPSLRLRRVRRRFQFPHGIHQPAHPQSPEWCVHHGRSRE